LNSNKKHQLLSIDIVKAIIHIIKKRKSTICW